MSRNAVKRLRSDRPAADLDDARCSSRAIPEPPSLELMTVFSCSIPSNKGSLAAPTREGSSPSSFAKVYVVISKESMNDNYLRHTLHSLLVSTTRSPRTRPQVPQTRSPLENSSTMLGFGSRQSGQTSRTARSGPKAGLEAD